jgi:Rad3-related DNA helicase
MAGQLETVTRALEIMRPADVPPEAFLSMPPSRAEQELMAERESLETALARVRFFVDADDREWIARYPAEPGATLELVPLTVASMASELLSEAADVVVLSSAYLGHRRTIAECFGLEESGLVSFASDSPFPLDQRRIEYRPVGALSKTTLARLEPVLFGEVAAILAAHPREKGLIHAPSYAAGRRLVAHLASRELILARRLIWVESTEAKTRALELHRASPAPTVLVSPSLREGVDLPDDFLRFQVVTKMPYPDLGDPWTAARQARDPRWYALETAKALVQAYGRSCRHAGDHGVTYILDGQFERFLAHYRVLLPPWFLDAVRAAMRARHPDASFEC